MSNSDLIKQHNSIAVMPQAYTFGSSETPFVLDSGANLSQVTVAYETWGTLRENNAILINHALTGSAHAAGMYPTEERPTGWWEPMIGPGKPIDTDKYFVICANVLGGCYGSTGPTTINPATGKTFAMSFPVITIRDMVRCQKALIDSLGVTRLKAVIGGSMGGMQAMEWATCYPEMMAGVMNIAACGRLYPQAIAFNSVGRQAILNDPHWKQGNYEPGSGPAAGLSLARMLATITYRSDQSMNQRFARQLVAGDDYFTLDSRFEVESYLHYHGNALVKRFDANSYLYLTKAMDLYDIAFGRPYSYEEALATIRAKFVAVGIDTDILFPPYQQQELVKHIQAVGGQAQYKEIKSPHGHDAFLIEFKQMVPIITDFLNSLED